MTALNKLFSLFWKLSTIPFFWLVALNEKKM
jgi:hypothetical protein